MKSLLRLTMFQDSVDEHDFNDKITQSQQSGHLITNNKKDDDEGDGDGDDGDDGSDCSGPRKDLGFHRPADAYSKHHVNVPIQVTIMMMTMMMTMMTMMMTMMMMMVMMMIMVVMMMMITPCQRSNPGTILSLEFNRISHFHHHNCCRQSDHHSMHHHQPQRQELITMGFTQDTNNNNNNKNENEFHPGCPAQNFDQI